MMGLLCLRSCLELGVSEGKRGCLVLLLTATSSERLPWHPSVSRGPEWMSMVLEV